MTPPTRQLPLAASNVSVRASANLPDAAGSLSPNTRPARASDDPGLVDAVCGIILELAEQHGRVTADDVRKLAPNIPFLKSVMGAAFRRLVQSHRIILVEFSHSRIPGNHGRRIGVYRLRVVKACLGPEIRPEVTA